MVNQTIVDYLSKYYKQYPLGSLKKKIISSGYSEAEVNEAIQILGLKENYSEISQQTNQPEKTSAIENNELLSQITNQPQPNQQTNQPFNEPAKPNELIEKIVKKNKSSKTLKITLLITFIIVIILLGILIFIYIKSSGDKSLPGENNIILSNAGRTATIKLKTETENITSVMFTFVDKSQKEYNYETSEGVSELKNEYVYVIDSDKIGLKNFNDISKLKVTFRFKSPEVNLAR